MHPALFSHLTDANNGRAEGTCDFDTIVTGDVCTDGFRIKALGKLDADDRIEPRLRFYKEFQPKRLVGRFGEDDSSTTDMCADRSRHDRPSSTCRSADEFREFGVRVLYAHFG